MHDDLHGWTVKILDFIEIICVILFLFFPTPFCLTKYLNWGCPSPIASRQLRLLYSIRMKKIWNATDSELAEYRISDICLDLRAGYRAARFSASTKLELCVPLMICSRQKKNRDPYEWCLGNVNQYQIWQSLRKHTYHLLVAARTARDSLPKLATYMKANFVCNL